MASVCATATMSNRNRAVAASEASETDESKAERLAAGRARHEVRNRISRLVAFVLCGALLFGVWSASTAQNETWSTSKLYLPSAGLELMVSGCDVAFVAGASPTLTYAARASVYSAEFSYDATDSSIVRSALHHDHALDPRRAVGLLGQELSRAHEHREAQRARQAGGRV